MLQIIIKYLGVAQFGRALDLGSRGRRFKSCRPDYFFYGMWCNQEAHLPLKKEEGIGSNPAIPILQKGDSDMFFTGCNKAIDFSNIPDAMLRYYEKNKEISENICIIIGTDSQNFSDTKMVSVICMIASGHGGIFFYEISHKPLISDVRTKLHTETNDSLNLAENIVQTLEEDGKYSDMYMHCPISIHVDAGNSEHGKTKALIPELVGWIKACGYQVETKPDSFVASTIADRISK